MAAELQAEKHRWQKTAEELQMELKVQRSRAGDAGAGRMGTASGPGAETGAREAQMELRSLELEKEVGFLRSRMQ
eukprot:434539-Rhodomonas_salina.1